MKLKAPVVAVGATLVGGVAQAQQPVTIEQTTLGYEITFVDSGTKVSVEQDEVRTTFFSPNKMGKSGGTGADTLRLSADGLEIEASEGLAPRQVDILGRSEAIEIEVAPNAINMKNPIWTLRIADDGPDDEMGSITVSDPSGASVRVDAAGFHVRVDAWAKPISVDVDGMGFDADGNWFLRVPDHVTVGLPDDLAGPDQLSVKDVRLDTITLTGRSTAARFEGLRAKDVYFAGDHTGVVFDQSLIQTLTAEGTLTGTVMGGSMIGQYFGPGAFNEGMGIIKKF